MCDVAHPETTRALPDGVMGARLILVEGHILESNIA
jgi:hypothetical protein